MNYEKDICDWPFDISFQQTQWLKIVPLYDPVCNKKQDPLPPLNNINEQVKRSHM